MEGQPPTVGGREILVRTTASSGVRLSLEECSQLYVWLGDSAPFVRNQLHLLRSGSENVSLDTSQECRDVLEAIEHGGSSLTSGLRSLKLALTSGTVPGS